MAGFLQVVAAVYAILLWSVIGAMVAFMPRVPFYDVGVHPDVILLLAGAGLTIPAAIMYAFGQIASDVRRIANIVERRATQTGGSFDGRERREPY